MKGQFRAQIRDKAPEEVLAEARIHFLDESFAFEQAGDGQGAGEHYLVMNRRPIFNPILGLACAIMGGFPFLVYAVYLAFTRYQVTLTASREGSHTVVSVGAEHSSVREPVESWLAALEAGIV